MKNRALIDYEEQTIIVRPEKDGGWFKAGDKELTILQEIKRDLFVKIGVSGENQIFRKDMQNEFYSEVYRIISEKYGWERYYKQIKIIFSPENIKKALPELEENLGRTVMQKLVEDNKLKLDQAIVDRLNKSAEKNFNKNIENLYYGDTTYFLPKDYLKAQESLAYYLVDWSSMDIILSPNKDDNIVDFLGIDDLFLDEFEC